MLGFTLSSSDWSGVLRSLGKSIKEKTAAARIVSTTATAVLCLTAAMMEKKMEDMILYELKR